MESNTRDAGQQGAACQSVNDNNSVVRKIINLSLSLGATAALLWFTRYSVEAIVAVALLWIAGISSWFFRTRLRPPATYPRREKREVFEREAGEDEER